MLLLNLSQLSHAALMFLPLGFFYYYSLWVCVVTSPWMMHTHAELQGLSNSDPVLLQSQHWKGERIEGKELWPPGSVLWHFGVSDPQKMSINGVFHFMEVCCILSAWHRSSQLSQQRCRSAKPHKSVFCFTLHEKLFKTGFWFISTCFSDGNASDTSSGIRLTLHYWCFFASHLQRVLWSVLRSGRKKVIKVNR